MLDTVTYLPQLKLFEGVYTYMYEDTGGNVTVGVGFMLPSAAAAQKLPFVRRPNLVLRQPVLPGPATAAEIQTDFDNVDKQKYGKGYAAGYYRQFTKLDLPIDAINRLLDAKVRDFLLQIVASFPGYNSWPSSACAAVFDMAYNLGIQIFTTQFSQLCKAIRDKNWATAAAQCHRRNIPETRNAWTKTQFAKAASESAYSAAR
jgi:GH24 family phage-related lysozyme (muramidase)